MPASIQRKAEEPSKPHLARDYVKRTFSENVLTGLGSFGSMYRLDLGDISEPVLVSGTDGGTKLKIAFLMDKHDTVGQDCVAMCVNDIVCQGAVPLFFLDYIATGRVQAEKIADIVKGIADGCVLSETLSEAERLAEMPSFYAEDEYDMAGFAVGIADKSRIIHGSKVAEGDILIGLPSSGIHSNGYSLVRKIFFDKMDLDVADCVEELGTTLGDALITPTRIYVKACKAVFGKYDIRTVSLHITGGGFYAKYSENHSGGTRCGDPDGKMGGSRRFSAISRSAETWMPVRCFLHLIWVSA